MQHFHKHHLDNPVWHSLSETHRDLAINYNNIKFYHPDYCPFGGFETNKDISEYIDEYAAMTGSFFIVGERPEISGQLKIKKELVCLQMIIDERIAIEIKEHIVKLTGEHEDALYGLVSLVQPGYFKRKTNLLGDYFGIFKNDELIAVTGERMKMNGFIEVSAIVTHPLHTRKGYAKQLIAATVNKILDENNMPYLHVAQDNSSAIALYERSGFKTRRRISFWNIIS